jgi:hypothetical protein
MKHTAGDSVMNFFEELKQQQWDDLRFYHQNRINQSLHLFSAISFLITYVLLFVDFTAAVFFGWFVAMVPRQIGHFVFEPHDYDNIHNVTDEYKESIKVGFNLKRKVVLISVWLGSTVWAYVDPTLLGTTKAYTNFSEFLDNLASVWAIVAIGGLLFRTSQIMYKQSLQSGLVWLYKIITEPVYNLPVYYKAPFLALKGDMIDPMTERR